METPLAAAAAVATIEKQKLEPNTREDASREHLSNVVELSVDRERGESASDGECFFVTAHFGSGATKRMSAWTDYADAVWHMGALAARDGIAIREESH